MDCQEFKNRLETIDTLSVPAELKEHGRNCVTCKKVLDTQERMTLGLKINRYAVQSPDLTARIMEKISHQKPEEADSKSLFERIATWIAPNTPLKSLLFYGTAGILIFALCHAIIDRGGELRALRQQHSWRLVSSEGLVHGIATGSIAPIPSGTRIECDPGAAASLAFGNRFRVSLHEAHVTLASGQIDIVTGVVEADITHIPTGHPIFIRTPHAEVEDIGTRFTVSVKNGSSAIVLHEGRLKVTATSNHQTRAMNPQDRVVIGSKGFEAVTGHESVLQATYTVSPDFIRQQTPDE